jgi:hypothetical protein
MGDKDNNGALERSKKRERDAKAELEAFQAGVKDVVGLDATELSPDELKTEATKARAGEYTARKAGALATGALHSRGPVGKLIALGLSLLGGGLDLFGFGRGRGAGPRVVNGLSAGGDALIGAETSERLRGLKDKKSEKNNEL